RLVDDLGVRVYAGPAFRDRETYMDAKGRLTYEEDTAVGQARLREAIDFVRKYDGSAQGRLRGMLNAAQVETCTESLLPAGDDAAVVPALPRGRRQPRHRHRHLSDGHRRRAALGLDAREGHRRQLSGRAAARRLQRGDARWMQVPRAHRSRPSRTRREGRHPPDRSRSARRPGLPRPDQGARRRCVGTRRRYRDRRWQGARAGRTSHARRRGGDLRESAQGHRTVLEPRTRLALGRRERRSHHPGGVPDQEVLMTRMLRSSVSIVLTIIALVCAAPAREAAAQGEQATWGVRITPAPPWLDP